jgi:hypothetical protein
MALVYPFDYLAFPIYVVVHPPRDPYFCPTHRKLRKPPSETGPYVIALCDKIVLGPVSFPAFCKSQNKRLY